MLVWPKPARPSLQKSVKLRAPTALAGGQYPEMPAVTSVAVGFSAF
ncbi:hypothetical protein SynWH8103_02784 [Synechococcus sp. WH 8103]|nr:hypothetical protein SynA18461_02832 [Synechococcus sp. A18-46.1]CRY93463.1 hypothetical protein SynWH8103_02784 [Synechococcus sp. WH 8103]